MPPLVSICLPTLNARCFLEPRMESILSQTLPDWELIVCDSHSDDGTWEYLQQFRNDRRVQLHQVPREGLYAGWNECLRRCRGEFVYMATADDTCKPELLARMVGALQVGTAPGRNSPPPDGGVLKIAATGMEPGSTDGDTSRPVDICSCRFSELDESGQETVPDWVDLDRFLAVELRDQAHVRPGLAEFFLHALFGPSWVTMTAVLFRRSVLDTVGLMPIEFGNPGDRAWAMLVSRYSDILWIPDRLATWRQHSGQATASRRTAPHILSILRVLRSVSSRHADWILEQTGMGIKDWLPIMEKPTLQELFVCQNLTRNGLRAAPLLFLRNWLRTVRVEPGETLSYTLRGLPYDAWQDSRFGDPDDRVAWARSLLSYLQISRGPGAFRTMQGET